jgi:DNA repair exonuclease SbcCD nuclease subunit
MKALVFSDLHLHAFKQFASYSSGDNSRRVELVDRLQQIVNLINAEYDCGIFSGDFFHERLRVDVVSASKAKAVLSGLQKPLIMCSGTHDITYSGHSSLEIFRDMFPAESPTVFIDERVELEVGGRTFVFVCVPDIGPAATMEKIRESRDRNAILITHGDFKGSQYGSVVLTEGIDAEYIRKHFLYSVVGHIHNYSQSPFGSGILVPGTCIPHTFGDLGSGRAWALSIDGSTVRKSSRLFPHPVFHTLDHTAAKALKVALSSEDYYRILVGPDTELEITPVDARYILVRPTVTRRSRSTVVPVLSLERLELIQSYATRFDGDVEFITKLGDLISSDVEDEAIFDELEKDNAS